MDISLERNNLWRLIHEETETLNRPIISKEIEWINENYTAKKRQGPYGFTGEFYQTWGGNTPELTRSTLQGQHHSESRAR